MTDAQTDTPAPEPRRDGRRMRADCTKVSLLAACRVILMGGVFQPTMEQVCGMAQVSPRSGFQHYGDIEALRVAALDDDGTVRDAMLRRLLDDCTHQLMTEDERMRVCRALVTGRAG